MKHVKVFCFAIGLALCSSMAARGQNAGSLSSRIMEALKTKEPGWKPIGVVENRPLLVPSERSILYAVWTSPKSRSEDVNVSVYSVENHDEAAAWLGPFRKKQVAAGWQALIKLAMKDICRNIKMENDLKLSFEKQKSSRK